MNSTTRDLLLLNGVYGAGVFTGWATFSIRPADASDDGTATITIETPPPEPPTLVDPTGMAVRPGGCTPVFLITFPDRPPGVEHMSDSGQSVEFDGTVCAGWGTDAINGTVELERIQANTATKTATPEVTVVDKLPPALEARLNEAIQSVQNAAAAVQQPAPTSPSWFSPDVLAILVVLFCIGAVFYLNWRKKS